MATSNSMAQYALLSQLMGMGNPADYYPQDMAEMGINNALGAFNNYGQNMANSINFGSALANSLSSRNLQSYYPASAQVTSSQLNNESAVRQAQIQAQAQQQLAQLQAQIAQQQSAQNLLGNLLGAQANYNTHKLDTESSASQAQLAAENALKIAQLQNEGQLSLERERSARLNTTLPALMSLFGGGSGGIGGGASISTNYGAGGSLGHPTTAPPSDQQFRPQVLPNGQKLPGNLVRFTQPANNAWSL